MKKTFFFILSLFLSMTISASPRTAEEAAELAAQFCSTPSFSNHAMRAPQKSPTMLLAHKVNKPNSTEEALFIFNRDNDGYVIVSADDNALDILGYSDEGTFDPNNIPSNMQFWLDYYAERIAAARPGGGTTPKRIRQAKTAVTIAPLLGNIKWNQTEPYNNLCPMDKDTRTYTGCIATAAAQIMYYYQWPVTGQGAHSYDWTSCLGQTATLSANFGETTYDWANMLERYISEYSDAQATAVATLMYHVGVACEMDYGGDSCFGSGSTTYLIRDGLVNHFRYKATHTYDLSTAELSNAFITELTAGRPVFMSGRNDESGHAFVCDGVDANGYFHINWGWDGSSNGFFALTSLNPYDQGIGGSASGQGYSQNIDCIIGLEPDRTPVAVSSITVSPATATLKMREQVQLSAQITPGNANNKSYTWTSSDENIATVSADGAVTGVSAGTAVITAKTNDGNKTGTCTITVTDEMLTAIKVDVNSANADYDDRYDKPWTIEAYQNNSMNGVPYVLFFPDGQTADKVAGIYTLSTGSGFLYNDPTCEADILRITSGQLAISCIEKNSGGYGCDTYHILSYFTCDDGMEYKVDVTTVMCAWNAGNIINMSDTPGEEKAYEVLWRAKGKIFADNMAPNGVITLPTYQPGPCEDKVFVGWSPTRINTETDIAPAFAKAGDIITTDATFYAVYATATITGSDITYSAYTTSCGTAETTYSITVNTPAHGTITTDPQNEQFAGSNVTITAVPDNQYLLSGITVKDAVNNSVAVSGNGNVRTFIMPESPVTISAIFNPIAPSGDITVQLDPQSAIGWNEVYLYAWTNNGNVLAGNWPGLQLMRDDNSWWSYTFFNYSGTVNIIWNNGSGAQTIDITNVAVSTCYRLNGISGTNIGVTVVDCPAEPIPAIYYTIRFINWDGTELQNELVKEGNMPEYYGSTPTRPETAQYVYSFSGWSPSVVPATADATYRAQFDATPKPQGIEEVPSDQVQSTKLIKNGQILILRGDKTYTLTGVEFK